MKQFLVIVFLMCSFVSFSQRYIVKTNSASNNNTPIYLVDTARNFITGNMAFIRTWITENITPSDTANFEITTIEPPQKHIKQIYRNREVSIDINTYLPVEVKGQARLPDIQAAIEDVNDSRLVYIRPTNAFPNGRLCLVFKTQILYFLPTPQ